MKGMECPIKGYTTTLVQGSHATRNWALLGANDLLILNAAAPVYESSDNETC